MDPLPISGASFWTTLDAKISAGGGAAHCNDGVLQYVAMKGPFNGPAQFIVQRTQTELFSTTVQSAMTAVGNAKAIINGNMWAVPSRNKASLFLASGTQAASQTVPIGEVLIGGVNSGGPSDPTRFQISFKAPSTTGARFVDGYEVGQGDPDGAALDGLGGLGPLIIGGLKFGNGNLYKAGVPAGAPPTGEPGTFSSFLTQRNNNTYVALRARGALVGKVAVAVHRASAMLLALVLPDDTAPGMELDVLRDKLAGVGVEDAVFMDGSDSALLAFNGRIVVHNGGFKDQFTTVGIGYAVG